ncbi:MAG: nuclear transport factor 2 family protein [Cyclobacteriaceae bacterium]|nr:nuclear transport factor 2 family protein [Cyclobacteriaceae bacterium]
MKGILISGLLIAGCSAFAQTTEASIMGPINKLFEGMHRGDSALIHQAFTEDVTFVTIGLDKQGQSFMKRGELKGFLDAMGTPHSETYSEPIWDVKIEVDGSMAQVWARYAFYLGNKFHHCGVDSFQLFNGIEGWKIYHLADTRQVDGCDVPKAIQDQFK